MVKKIRRQFNEVRGKKHHVFDDLDPTIRRCLTNYGHLFPKLWVNKRGSGVIYHFGVEEVGPISIEKEHGSREYLPPRYAKGVIARIETLLDYIEQSPAVVEELAGEHDPEPPAHETGVSDDATKKGDAIAADEGSSALPKPKLPDGAS